jgi:hypothetical protein
MRLCQWNKETQVHRLISEPFAGCAFRAIPDPQQGVRCREPRDVDRGVSNHTPQGGASEGNVTDDALLLNQGKGRRLKAPGMGQRE